MLELLGRMGRRPDVKRKLLEFLRNDCLVVSARIGDARRHRRTHLQPDPPPEIRNQARGILTFGHISGEGERSGRSFRQLEQRRALRQRAGNRDDGALDRFRRKQRLDAIDQVAAGRFDPDQPPFAEQAQRRRLVGEQPGVRLDRCPSDNELLRAERFEKPRRKRARLSLVLAEEQIEADFPIRLVDRSADRRP